MRIRHRLYGFPPSPCFRTKLPLFPSLFSPSPATQPSKCQGIPLWGAHSSSVTLSSETSPLPASEIRSLNVFYRRFFWLRVLHEPCREAITFAVGRFKISLNDVTVPLRKSVTDPCYLLFPRPLLADISYVIFLNPSGCFRLS